MTPIKAVMTGIMLSLRRLYLERQIDRPFNPTVSAELDAVILKQEALHDAQRTEGI